MRSLFLFYIFGIAVGSLTSTFIYGGYNKILVGLFFLAIFFYACYLEEKEERLEKEFRNLWKKKK